MFIRPKLHYPEIPYHYMLMKTVERYPEKTAIIFKDYDITFRELDSLSNSLANALIDFGVEKGDRVALYLKNGVEYVISFAAASKIGAIITPMNPSYKEREVEYQLNDSEAKAVILQEFLYPILESIKDHIPSLKHIILVGKEKLSNTYLFEQLIRGYPAQRPREIAFHLEEDIAVLPYSSGTTGLPKGVMLTHKNVVTNLTQFSSAGQITEKDVLIIFLPFYHIYGTMLMGVSFYTGATQIIMEGFDVQKSLEAAEKYRISLYYAVPPVLLALSHFQEINKYDLSSLRYITVGAAPLAPEVARRVKELIGIPIVQAYGLTETSPLTHFNPIQEDRIKLESVGLAMSDQEQRIVDLETGKDLGPGQAGEVVVKGPHVMKGYWKNPEETQRIIKDGWLYTGDIGMLDEDGYLYILDRKKEMIKYKGFAVAPAEVEAVLHQHPAVGDCAVIGKPDPEAGEIPKGLVLLKEGIQVSKEELIQFVAERIAGYKKLREIEFVSEIPRTPSGKILRRLLAERESKK